MVFFLVEIHALEFLFSCYLNMFLSFSILGLFNISDEILVSLDILLEWRELFKKGCPVAHFISAKSEHLAKNLTELKINII